MNTIQFNLNVKMRVAALVGLAGLNEAHDFDGVKNSDDVIGYLDALINYFVKKNESEKMKNETTIKDTLETFESFVNQYPKYLELAKKYHKSPGKILELLAAVGDEVLKRSNDLLITELSNNLKTFVSAKDIKLSQDSLNALDNLFKFIKEKSQEA